VKYTVLALFGGGAWFRNAMAAAVAVVGSWLAAYWGDAPVVMKAAAYAAVLLYLCDFIAGSSLALVEHRWKSAKIGANLLKLLTYFLSLIAGSALGNLACAAGTV